MYIENVSGKEVEIVNFLRYLNDFENSVGVEEKNSSDAYTRLADEVEGCLSYRADGFYVKTANREFSFWCIEEGEKYVFEYEGMREL